MDNNKSNYKQIISYDEATVVAQAPKVQTQDNSYQSEAKLEQDFIKQLINQGYEHIDLSKININHEDWMLDNLRKQLEILNKQHLNNGKFSDNEWNQLLNNYICNDSNETDSLISRTKKIQKDYYYTLTLDNNKIVNIYLINKKNIHNNQLQVINQYVNDKGEHQNRYDVTILINGLPLVHIELKRRGVALKEAYNQINRYKKSFDTSKGLFNYVQIFIISNGVDTKYYSNTVRKNIISLLEKNLELTSNTSNSFAFTNYWSDQKNNIINDVESFTATFLAKHTLLNIITKYCILSVDNKLIVMRPYQIVATEEILKRIFISHNYKERLGTTAAGGYIWHTTGSGKTITSFKTAQIAKEFDFISKVMFVVDRKDLDYQTLREYENFEKGSSFSSKSSKDLKDKIESKDNKIIITTIQKLNNLVKEYNKLDIYNEHVVMIFDECHRSQFGQMHQDITKRFKKYNIFGFTGTPIFKQNATVSFGIKPKEIVDNYKEKMINKTTEQLFGDKLHTYTIINAINDKNVLPFRYSEHITLKNKEWEDIIEEKIKGIDIQKVWNNEKRITHITKYIIDNFNTQTHSNKTYEHKVTENINELARDKQNKIDRKLKIVNLKGFNSILAVSNIEAAKKYYLEFKKQLSSRNDIYLKIGLIYSYAPNEESRDYDGNVIVDENNENVNGLDKDSREFLDSAINDYNKMFGTSFSTNGEEFQNYYRDISMRTKNKEIDILIVVNMFLTGFDATTLNTLWVDKNLKYHGLIQAFSRTNRILNSEKQYGNIISFRPLTNHLNDAIKLFGDEHASGVILLRKFEDYYLGYDNQKGYEELINILLKEYDLNNPNSYLGEQKQINFIKLFSKVLNMRNILYCFEEFKGKEILSEREFQNYLGKYQDIYEEIKVKEKSEKKDISQDLVFEIDLVKQVDINVDYIFEQFRISKSNELDGNKIIELITTIINSSYELRSKKKLLVEFLMSINPNNEKEEIWEKYNEFMDEQQEVQLDQIIKEYNLNPKETKKYMERCFSIGYIKETGTEIGKIMPPMSKFQKPKDGKYDYKNLKDKILDALKIYFNTFNQL